MEPRSGGAPVAVGAEGKTITPMTAPQQETASHIGERGFDTLNSNPFGALAVVLALLVFATACYWGSRFAREAGRKGEAERRAFREAVAAKDAERERNGA